MTFGERPLKRRSKGRDVEELQLRLAGFKGTVWDGDFGPKTKLQVTTFQKDFMKMERPNGVVDAATFKALDDFAKQFPIDFADLHCPQRGGDHRAVCNCDGFGQNRFRKIYYKAGTRSITWSRSGKEEMQERRHQFEYPGIHKAVLHTYRAFLFYAPVDKYINPRITSGYRCHINNVTRGRGSTNHMGKALDFTFDVQDNVRKRDVCNEARTLLKNKSNCQVRWEQDNQKALEPGFPRRGNEFIATTWVHLDVRNYNPDTYLQDRFFVRTAAELD
ncbi:MAG: peptidoglycan-binding protein, partial [Bacteroidota bacterium]